MSLILLFRKPQPSLHPLRYRATGAAATQGIHVNVPEPDKIRFHPVAEYLLTIEYDEVVYRHLDRRGT
jgi:hypothetical protein